MPFFQDESESHLKNSTTDISDSADYQWNAASAQGFLTAVTDGKHILQLSTILYARESFPDDCFQTVPSWAWNWKISHHHLFRAGTPLSGQTRDRVLGQNEPLVYFRASENHRLHHFVDALVTRVFPAIEQKSLGKILVCFSKSKTNEPGALVEFYSLKFRYTEMGSMYTHISWGGSPGVAIPNCENPFMEFLRTRVPFDCIFYTHLSFYFIDGRPLDAWQQHDCRHRASEAVLDLQCNEKTMVRRICTLVYHSRAIPAHGERARHCNAEKPRPSQSSGLDIDMESETSTKRRAQTMRQHSSASPSKWLSPAWIDEAPGSLFNSNCSAHPTKDPSDKRPTIQLLSSQRDTHMATMDVGSLELPTIRRQSSLFADRNMDLHGYAANGATSGPLRTDHASGLGSPAIDYPSQLPASPIGPPSSGASRL